MKWLKLTFIVALAIIFVGTSFVAIFGAGRILGQVFKTYIFKYETCEYRPLQARSIEELQQEQASEKECYVDYNRAKRDISDGLAMLIIAFPIAWLSQRALRRSIKEAGE